MTRFSFQIGTGYQGKTHTPLWHSTTQQFRQMLPATEVKRMRLEPKPFGRRLVASPISGMMAFS